jgi:UDP-glucose 6-dehydrogenase
VVEESQAIDIAKHLASSGYRVIVYDPQAIEAAKSELGDQIESATDVASCAAAADLLIIATPWPSFRDLPLQALRRPNGHRLPVIDCWRLLPRAEVATVVDLIYPGQARAMLDDEPEPILVRTRLASA